MKYRLIFVLTTCSASLLIPSSWATPSNHPMPIVEVVTTTRDSGRGSLRAAIESANRNAKTRISFQIPGKDAGYERATRTWKIAPSTPLPALQKPDTRLECDGSVVISGEKMGANGTGLKVEALRCLVKGMKWTNWGVQTISIRASDTRIENNAFRGSPVGILVSGEKSRRNRFGSNTFTEVGRPVALNDGSNDRIMAPELKIERSDVEGQVGHVFTVRFRGKAHEKVTLELGYSSNEARQTPQIEKVRETTSLKTDASGVAIWQFRASGYPVGSWVALATQNGSTSEFSSSVVMPYLR